MSIRAFAFAAVLAVSAAASAATVTHPELAGDKERDRQAILAMVGTFEVHFTFEETQTFGGATPSEPHDSTAREIVVLLEDAGDFISMQHILVVGKDLDMHAIKHWRQDWQYEDTTLHGFQGGGTWKPERLSKEAAAGTWSQSVYMVDDSPRYEGFGRWKHTDGYSYWESNDTWRPLPRREVSSRDDYDVVAGTNRHAITADGWLHEQDNVKLALRDGTAKVVAREKGFNAYKRIDMADKADAMIDWEATKEYWALVREAWSAIYGKESAFTIVTIEDKNPLWRAVSELAEDYTEGKLGDDAAAKAKVAETIAGYIEYAPSN